MLKLISNLLGVLFGVSLCLLGGMFKLLDRTTGAVPGTPTQDRGANLFVVVSILGIVTWFVCIYLLTEGAFDPR